MKIIIFAGGAGTRLWPLSLRNSPKQFEKFKDNKSTLQMAIERVQEFGMKNIFISTNEQYVPLVKKQLKGIKKENIFTEPVRRDVAAAVGLSLMRLKKLGISGTVAVLWSDHFMKHPDRFVDALKKAEKLIEEEPNRFVFLGENPRFANHNLGWINIGKNIKGQIYEFRGWKYRPEISLCEKMFASGQWMWNPGYFVFDIDFVLGLYEKFQLEMYKKLEKMSNDERKIKEEYPKLEAVSFDNAIVEKVDNKQAIVLKVNLGWSDPGTLYALKEALSPSTNDNYEKGKVVSVNSTDSFLYNEEKKKILSTVGLEGMVVVNTKKAILVCPKDQVPEIKTLLKKIEEENMEEYL